MSLKLSDKIKVKIIEKLVNPKDIEKLMNGMSNEGKLIAFLKKSSLNLTMESVNSLIKDMPEEDLVRLIDIFYENEQKFRIPAIASKLTTDKNKIYAIYKIKDSISSFAAWEIADSMEEDESRFKIIDILKDIIELSYLKFYISMREDKSKLELLKNYSDKFDINILRVIFEATQNKEIKMLIRERLIEKEILSLLLSSNIKSDNLENGIKFLTRPKDYIDKNEVLLNSTLNLPEKMSFGIEIESEGRVAGIIEEYFNFSDWKAKLDGTLVRGVEVTSPILYSNEKASNEIYLVNKGLKYLGQSISKRCGGHIHIGADYLTSKQSYINLMEIWCNTEKVLYAISNEENTAPRSEIPSYASPIAIKTQEALEKGTINLEDEVQVDTFIEGLKQVQGDRFSGINFLNINDEKNTIEFRIPNGTLNPDLWIDNINLFGGIVKISEQLSKIQEKGIENEEDRDKLNLLEKLKQEISEKEKLECLLTLIGLEPIRYFRRYNANIELINSNSKEEPIFSNEIKPIVMDKKKVKSSFEH